MMENLRLEHGKGCFLFFLFVSKGEHEAAGPIAYEYLLHTWGVSAGRGEELEPERGAAGGPGAALAERGGGRNRPRGPCLHQPASATVYRGRPRARSCTLLPLPRA